MTSYLTSRVLQAIITIIGISIVVFALSRLSGDAAALLIPPDASERDRLALREQLGLDKPIIVQYALFLKGALSFDFGNSFRFGKPALDVYMERFPATLQLAFVASLISAGVGVLIGVYSAVKSGGLTDRAANLVALMGQAIPSFAISILMIVILAVEFRLLPTSGMGDWTSFIMPAIALSWYSLASLTRMTRSSMHDVLDTEYVRLARLKGLPERTVIWKHAFRNAMLPILTLFSLQLVFFISGSVIVESIFAWPGVGQLSIQAIQARDYPLVQAIVFLSSVLLVALNLGVDVLYGFIDPRIRLS
ncbi:ABC transporter permease [Chelatococcus reniformis]|uniref:Glutathione ABC transporter permease n=1 Tax=Chelatococcus reniformis TaxID=1494448 RepID=A0A916X6W4_9HYPH|nr:ABC transporter permease [Chelatococcus reniformis]GGC48409.1 glutathione ABC transporter permease [Chelatococcus reniformis]